MAANRYGRIYHSDHRYINLRFPSADARRAFATKFEAYHEGHDHDGEAPRFEDTPAATIGNPEANTIHDAHSVSIDGYATYEIEAYHNPDRWNTYDRGRYRPPTCCVPPVISINRTFIDSSTLTRHELSAIFMDMPEEDFENLLKSVETEGFKDPVIRMIDTQVLDGWHRYRAAKELNVLRKLRFQQWNEKDEGDPAAFVYARNMERRHLTPSQRGQIVVSFNKRAGAGNPNLTSPNDEVKTREQLAKEANVGTSTIDRAVKVDDMGRADEVIRGEKTQGEVIKEETLKSLWEQIHPAISAWKHAREGVGHASKTMFIKSTLRWEGLESDTETDVKILKQLLYLLTTTDTNVLETLVRKQLDGKSLWDFDDDAPADAPEPEPPTETAPTEVSDREAQRLLKQKKMVLKAMWETRKEASKVWMGDADNDLLTLDLKELEKGFAENNPAYAEAFKVAMQRISSVASLEELVERVLILDIGILQLETENRALTTYIGDLRNWRRPDWSPDTNWILPLIQAKKAAAAPEPEAPEDMDVLWEAFNKRLPTWRSKYAESGYKENDLIQAATEVELFDALRSYRHSDRTGLPTAAEIKDVTDLMKRASYPYARHVRNLLRAKQQACEIDASPLVSGEGLSDVDRYYDDNQRQVLRTLIAPLLERLGADDDIPVLNQELRSNIAADIGDVFISYENPPADKQIVILLLDYIDSVLSEPIE